MGIAPTYPSTKFGYVVPQADTTDAPYQLVQRFTEKPDEERANELGYIYASDRD
jgi:mannose-1-phosphate guanylyltransferase